MVTLVHIQEACSPFNYGLLLIIFGFAGFTTLEAVLLSASESTMFRRKVKPLIIARNKEASY